MNTTESLVGAAKARLAAAISSGDFPAEKDARQEIIAHETLARLRAEFEANPSEPLAGQIAFWVRQVGADVDEPVKPKRREPKKPEESAPVDSA